MAKRALPRKKPKPPSYGEEADQRGIYRVRFSIEKSAFGRDDYDAIIAVRGSILFIPDESERTGDDDEKQVGSVNGFLLKRSLVVEEGGDFFDECDAHSQEALDYASALFDPTTDEVRQDVDRALAGVVELDALALDLIEVIPEHRGHGVALAAASRFLQTFQGGCGIAICKPFPLQFDGSRNKNPAWVEHMKMANFEQDKLAATRKLQAYWGRLGFKPLPEPPYWAMNLAYVQPTRADLGLV